jgi:putative tryptophan/tyrosine transport system substrate-binding protein
MSAYDPKRTLGLIATLIGGVAAAWPLAARAQQASRVRVGFVDFAGDNDSNALDRARVFKQGLERLGWSPEIDYYWSVFNVERAQRAAQDVLRLTPDVIVCAGTPACHKQTYAVRQTPSWGGYLYGCFRLSRTTTSIRAIS